MTDAAPATTHDSDRASASTPARAGIGAYLRLIRVRQWSKSVFVLIGPVYSLQDGIPDNPGAMAWAVGAAAIIFALASSACYIFNDLQDIESDRAHPRKRLRPLPAGLIAPKTAVGIAIGLVVAAFALLFTIPGQPRLLVGGLVLLHVVNVTTYSVLSKHRVIVDVLSLSMGFVFRVLAGCAAALVEPSTWLLNVTLFLAMLLAFGKRLGERRTMGSSEGATAARKVQAKYSDDLLRMLVVVSGVATLLTYAGYIQTRDADYTHGFNLLWVTMLPATFGLLRAITLLERGDYDDPTELAARDRPFQGAALVFGGLTGAIIFLLPA
ncbi:MAG: UbiA family prenyltransferase [Planctomycetota bacterium]